MLRDIHFLHEIRKMCTESKMVKVKLTINEHFISDATN